MIVIKYGEWNRLMEICPRLKKEKVVRPRLNGCEIWTVYRLIDAEYWRARRYGERDAYFKMLSRLRRKLLKDLNACREDKISIKQKV
jgi:NADPH-dependent 7-cyano-7-deazaguanine reductase QueF-like protein